MRNYGGLEIADRKMKKHLLPYNNIQPWDPFELTNIEGYQRTVVCQCRGCNPKIMITYHLAFYLQITPEF